MILVGVESVWKSRKRILGLGRSCFLKIGEEGNSSVILLNLLVEMLGKMFIGTWEVEGK